MKAVRPALNGVPYLHMSLVDRNACQGWRRKVEGKNEGFVLLTYSLGLRPKKAYASVALVRVPIQSPLTPSVMSVTSVGQR
jgi:hypothetical protein